jgi:hypothetical protein
MEHLKEDEKRWINIAKERCETCGHLKIFHNTHCCPFCLIPGCNCRYEELGGYSGEDKPEFEWDEIR